jgi:hypothetical protein
MEESRMDKHVTVVGVLQIAFGILGLIGTIIVIIAFNFVDYFVEGDEVATLVLWGIKLILSVFLAFFSIIKIIGGIGILKYKSWARYVVIVLAVFSCFNVPFGTLVGVYSLWALLRDETIALFVPQTGEGSKTD